MRLAALMLLASCYAGAVRQLGPGELCAFDGDCRAGLECRRDDVTRTCTMECASDRDCRQGSCCRLTEEGYRCSYERCGSVLAGVR